VKKAIIVTVNAKDKGRLEELIALAETLGYTIVKVFSQQRKRPDPRFLLGKGKFKELINYVKGLQSESKRDNITIIFDGNLKPIQFFNIYRELKNVNILDRVQLILEIFDEHAGTREAKLQIELARLKHVKPIVKEWIRQRKIGELPGFLGSGKYDVDAYYLMIKRRITRITQELEKLRKLREKLRKSRRKAGINTVAIIGYTSAGKTSIFNALTGERKKVGEEPFTTLTTKHKAVILEDNLKVLLMDTVGFIDYIPVEIIEAFYSTLEEIVESSLLLLIIDVSEEINEVKRKIRGVFETLRRIGVSGKPMIVVFNKIDLVEEEKKVEEKVNLLKNVVSENYENIVTYINASAKKGFGISEITKEIVKVLKKDMVKVFVSVPESKLGEIYLPLRIISRSNGFYKCEVYTYKDYLLATLKTLKKVNAQ